MKTCGQYSELVPALAEDVLSAAEADEVRSHIAGCPACSDSWRIQELISRHLRETDLADKPDYYWAKQRRRILDQVGFSTSRILRVERPRGSFLKIAAAVAAALLVAVGVLAILRKPEDPGNGGIVRPKTWLDDDQKPVVKEVPREAPDTPVEPAGKDEDVVKPPSSADPKPDQPLVDDQKPEPEKEPAPPKKDEEVVKGAKTPPKSGATTTEKDPPKEEPAAPKTDAESFAILPGGALYPDVLAHEQAAILMPLDDGRSPVLHDRNTVEQAIAILKSAAARLEEIRRLTEKDPKADVHELVDAYCVLVGEGAMPVMIPLALEGKTLGASRKELRAHQAELEKFPEELKKGPLAPALQTCIAANDMKIRRHAPRSSSRTGALASAREIALFIAHPGSGTATIPLRVRWGHAVAGRIQSELLDHVRAGRDVEANGLFAAYRTMAEGVVRMIEWLDAKDAARVCAESRRELQSNLSRFRAGRATDTTRPVLAAALPFLEGLFKQLDQIEEAARTGKMPRPDRRDPPKDPKGDPPPPQDPPPKPPPFGEPAPPPPPPPKGEGFDEPK